MISLLNFQKSYAARNGTPYASTNRQIILEDLYMVTNRFALISSVIISLASPGGVFGNFITFPVRGDDAASIQATVDAFRAALGNPNNANAPGLASGRREINWDGGGSATTLSETPFDGFLNNRGALFETTASMKNPEFIQAPPSGFATFTGNPALSTLGVFSQQRLFSPIGSNITDVSFFIPGTNGGDRATVNGFGAIFSDVDLPDSTRIEFFGISNNLLFSQAVLPASVNDGLSFLGAIGNAGEEIFRVRITSGNTPIDKNSGEKNKKDIVAMDDFIYGEPKSVPESGGIALMVLGLGSVLLWNRRSLAAS